MLKFLCLVLIAVAITTASPVGEQLLKVLATPASNVANPAVEDPAPAVTLAKQADPGRDETLTGGDKDESLDKSETFGFGYYPRFYGGWGGYGGWGYGGYHGYGPYGWGRSYYGGWRRPIIYWG